MKRLEAEISPERRTEVNDLLVWAACGLGWLELEEECCFPQGHPTGTHHGQQGDTLCTNGLGFTYSGDFGWE
ncbi:hypothetical protein CEXT_178481 [Caerostris extrusa]|uniref:Uncharacterized protein n=1 Tax=Caerostris extrusa TaxID=172846 RepID=A0AAV4TEK7_CAEEX|nr:hypothetical protein CEXT_178481 [Caerostris extrusa]